MSQMLCNDCFVHKRVHVSSSVIVTSLTVVLCDWQGNRVCGISLLSISTRVDGTSTYLLKGWCDMNTNTD